MHLHNHSVRVGPNSVLTRTGLLVDGLPQVLAHSDNLANLVFNTSSLVAELLMTIFPNAVAIPLENGQVEASTIPAWEHYARNALNLKAAAPGSGEAIAAGRVVLQWCVATTAAIEIGHPVARDTAAFTLVDYLARHGAEALACTRSQWDAYGQWLLDEQSMNAFWARMDGKGQPSPKPAAVSIIAPWPESLGAQLGGPAKLLDNVFSFSSDVLMDDTGAWVRSAGLFLRVDVGQELARQFDSIVPRDAAREVADCALDASAGGQSYAIRAQRMKVKRGYQYVFRLLQRSAMTDQRGEQTLTAS